VSHPLFNVSSGSGGNKNVPKLCPSRSNISKLFQVKPKAGLKKSENPRASCSILSLNTMIKKLQRDFSGAFSAKVEYSEMIKMSFEMLRFKRLILTSQLYV
jgi:hypothetical protein